jgi:hypothetical protein
VQAAGRAVLVFLGSTLAGSGQEAVRSSLAGEQASQTRQAAIQNQDYNIQYGMLRFLVESGLEFEYNDNISYSSENGLADEIIKARVRTRAYVPVTEQNTLNLTLGAAYWKYLENSQYDYFELSDGSELAFDVFVKDFRFTLYDRFSYTEDPVQHGELSGLVRFGGLNNTAGLKTIWDLNKMVLTADYGYANFISSNPIFDFTDRTSELLFLRNEVRLNPLVSFGPELSGNYTGYDQKVLHDGFGYSAGVFGRVRWSTYLETTARAGFTGSEFQSFGATDSVHNPQTYYWGLEARHRLNESVTHGLWAGRELRPGYRSDYVTLNTVRYAVDWRLLQKISLQAQVAYENGSYPAIDLRGRPNPYGREAAGETYNRIDGQITFSYKLMEKVTAAATYRHLLKGSDRADLDYGVNQVLLHLTYRF